MSADPKPPIASPDFWKSKTLDELIAEQGVKPLARFEDLFGAGADLWDDDEDFERFMEYLRESRRTGG
jgi:hypothetical protein